MNKTRGFRNVGAGILAQSITIAMGIIIPRLVLVNLGSEANGLLSSISNVLTYMTLLEAGVGSATLQALYKPIAEKNIPQINGILSATHYFYRRTGVIYFTIVAFVATCYALFVRSGIPRIQVFLVVLLAGSSGVLSYFFQGKFKILLSAEGKKYVSTNISTGVYILVSLSKVAVLLLGGNVVMVQLAYFACCLIQMIVFVIYIRKNYRWLNYREKPDFAAISQRHAVLVHQIAYLIFNNTDVLILTFFATLKDASVYSIYAMIYGEVKTIAVITDGFLYILGQNYHNREHFVKLFDIYQVYTMAITTALFCITRIMILPFLRLYTNGVEDINYIDKYLPWLFAAFYLLHNGRQASMNLIDIAQKFEDTKWRSVLEAAINITVSLILTPRLGIYGVLIGTIVALLYRTNDAIIYASKLIERSSWVTYRRWMTNIGLFVIISVISSRITFNINSYGSLILVGALLVVIILPLFILVDSIMESKVASYGVHILKDMIKSRKKSSI